MIHRLTLELTDDLLAVCKLESATRVPDWALRSEFYSISKTSEELSIVCAAKDVPPGIKTEKNWRCLKVKGPLDFGLTGILASLANPLAQATISIFAISTFDTDYVLVKEESLKRSVEILRQAGHEVVER